MTALFPHQVEIIKKAYDRRCFAIFGDCGIGKTRCAIELIRMHYGAKALVVAPNTVLENWADEIKKFSNLKCEILQGTKLKRQITLLHKADVFVINYEALRILYEDLHKSEFKMIILDESQKIKGYKTLQSKTASKLGQQIPYRIIMTGTPITNNPLDIFGQYRFLNPFIFGFSFYKFRARYAVMGGYMNYQVTQFINLDELKQKVYTCAIRVKKEDCLKLPEKLYQTVKVDLTEEQSRVYKALRQDFIADMQGKTITAPYVLTRLIRFSQVTAGFCKAEDKEEINFKTNPKLVWLKEFIDGLPKEEKVVIFCRFIKEIRNLTLMFKQMQITNTCIWGEVKDRQDRIKRFQDPKGDRILIGQVETSGLGINLHAARYCVFLSNSYSHGSRLQCEERLHRIGQDRNVTYIDVLARGTIDVTILRCLKNKEELAMKVVDELRVR